MRGRAHVLSGKGVVSAQWHGLASAAPRQHRLVGWKQGRFPPSSARSTAQPSPTPCRTYAWHDRSSVPMAVSWVTVAVCAARPCPGQSSRAAGWRCLRHCRAWLTAMSALTIMRAVMGRCHAMATPHGRREGRGCTGEEKERGTETVTGTGTGTGTGTETGTDREASRPADSRNSQRGIEAVRAWRQKHSLAYSCPPAVPASKIKLARLRTRPATAESPVSGVAAARPSAPETSLVRSSSRLVWGCTGQEWARWPNLYLGIR